MDRHKHFNKVNHLKLAITLIWSARPIKLMQNCLETQINTVNKITLPEPVTEPSASELIPLSFAQQRLWFFSQLEPNSALYNIPTALRLTGLLDVDALEKSLNAIL